MGLETLMNADARIPTNALELPEDEYLQLTHLSAVDLDRLALSWAKLALRGDKTTAAIAEALGSVAYGRHATAAVRARIVAVSRVWAPLRKMAQWALLRR